MSNAVTWDYAIFCWTRHATASGTPERTLLQALMTFDLFGCCLDTFRPEEMEPECRDTIKRVVFPSRHTTVISKLAENL